MSGYVKVMNSLRDNPKMLEVGDGAFRLYVCALCYSNEHLTDGTVTRRSLVTVAPGLRNPAAKARELVGAGLWETLDSGDWLIHDYTAVQRSAAQIREIRRKDRDRKIQTDSERVSVRNPDGIQTESSGTPSGLPTFKEEEEERKKENPLRPRSAAEEESSPQVIALCELLATLIVGNDPKATPSPQSSLWRKSARLLLEKDSRDFEEAQRVIQWCQADEFWRSNILSMPKLREKYAQLSLKMGNGKPAPQHREAASKTGREQWIVWAQENVPDLPVSTVVGAVSTLSYAGAEVTPENVRARVKAASS